MLKNKNVFLFDMDGLLLDTEALHVKLWHKIFDKYHLNEHEDLITKVIGTSGDQARMIAKEMTGDPDFLNRHEEEKALMLKDYLKNHDLKQKKGAEKLLSYLYEHDYDIILVSSTFEEGVERALAKGHLSHWIDKKVCGDHVKYSKPNPDIYLRALSLYNHQAEECVVLEDSKNGIKASNAAGIDVIGVPDLIDLSEMKEEHLIAVVPSLEDVLEMVK